MHLNNKSSIHKRKVKIHPLLSRFLHGLTPLLFYFLKDVYFHLSRQASPQTRIHSFIHQVNLNHVTDFK